MLEHLFVAEVLKALWRCETHAEVLQPQTDDAGYDLVIECRGVLRHIQLKSSHSRSKTARVNVNVAHAAKPGGCVIWLVFDEESLAFTEFRWLGGAPHERLPELGGKVAKHTKGDATGKKSERPNIRVVPTARFVKLDSINDVVARLFGAESPRPAPQPGSNSPAWNAQARRP